MFCIDRLKPQPIPELGLSPSTAERHRIDVYIHAAVMGVESSVARLPIGVQGFVTNDCGLDYSA